MFSDFRRMRVLVACEFSGQVRDAFLRAGHDAMSCDLRDTERPGPHYRGDVRDVLDGAWDLMVAHPPCTRLANSGVRWLSEPPPGYTADEVWAEMEAAVAFYKLLQAAPIPLKAIENPVMHQHARDRIEIGLRQVVQPWWFGHRVFKATGLELIGLPPLVPTNKLTPPRRGTLEHRFWSEVHMEPGSSEQAKNRSRTYRGIAEAMADQWAL